ncbi:MAG: hypothetical protein K2X77_06210 [Candidatus Obscuribacterales bacterium]|nr:hypothetical protein [Candidatus Obscuribacterales bacterium]
MRLLLVILTLISASCMQAAFAKDSLGKYQKLSLKLSELCKSQANEVDLIRAIRNTGGLRSSNRPSFVKTNAINFPQRVRLRILKDGNWDLITEEPSDITFFKVEHYAPSSRYHMFAFANAKLIEPGSVKKTDRPTIVVFTPNKVIVVATEYKQYYLLDRPDLEFARIKYKNQIE